MAVQSRRVCVLNSYVSYLDTRAGEDTVVLLHDISSSAEKAWGRIIPHVQGLARCLAPDMLGMGQSGPHPMGHYRFKDQYKYFDAWTRSVKLPERFVLVGKGWGASLAMRWAYNHRGRVVALVFVDGLVGPLSSPDEIENDNSLREAVQMAVSAKGSKSASRLLEDSDFCMEMLLQDKGSSLTIQDGGLSERQRLAFRACAALLRDTPLAEGGSKRGKRTSQMLTKYGRRMAEDSLPKLNLVLEGGVFASLGARVTQDWRCVTHVSVPRQDHGDVRFEQQSVLVGKTMAKFIKQMRNRN